MVGSEYKRAHSVGNTIEHGTMLHVHCLKRNKRITNMTGCTAPFWRPILQWLPANPSFVVRPTELKDCSE